MSGIRGLILGVAGLSLMEVIVTSKTATANTNAGVTLVADGLRRWLDPYTPLIPNLAGYHATFTRGGNFVNMPGSTAPTSPTGVAQAHPAVATMPPGASPAGGTYPV